MRLGMLEIKPTSGLYAVLLHLRVQVEAAGQRKDKPAARGVRFGGRNTSPVSCYRSPPAAMLEAFLTPFFVQTKFSKCLVNQCAHSPAMMMNILSRRRIRTCRGCAAPSSRCCAPSGRRTGPWRRRWSTRSSRAPCKWMRMTAALPSRYATSPATGQTLAVSCSSTPVTTLSPEQVAYVHRLGCNPLVPLPAAVR